MSKLYMYDLKHERDVGIIYKLVEYRWGIRFDTSVKLVPSERHDRYPVDYPERSDALIARKWVLIEDDEVRSYIEAIALLII